MKILIITLLAALCSLLVSCQTTQPEPEPEPTPVAKTSSKKKSSSSTKKSTSTKKTSYTKKSSTKKKDYVKPQTEEAVLKKIAETEQSTIPYTPPTTSFPSVPAIPGTSEALSNAASSSIPSIPTTPPPVSSSVSTPSPSVNIAPALPRVSDGGITINQDSVLE